MNGAQNKQSTGKVLVVVVLVAVIAAVVTTLVQHLVFGNSSVAITGS